MASRGGGREQRTESPCVVYYPDGSWSTLTVDENTTAGEICARLAKKRKLDLSDLEYSLLVVHKWNRSDPKDPNSSERHLDKNDKIFELPEILRLYRKDVVEADGRIRAVPLSQMLERAQVTLLFRAKGAFDEDLPSSHHQRSESAFSPQSNAIQVGKGWVMLLHFIPGAANSPIPYYFHEATGKTVWERPPELGPMLAVEEAAIATSRRTSGTKGQHSTVRSSPLSGGRDGRGKDEVRGLSRPHSLYATLGRSSTLRSHRRAATMMTPNHRGPRMSGVLDKRGKRNTGWKTRYFVLLGNELKYYKAQNDSRPLGVIKLQESFARESDSTYYRRRSYQPPCDRRRHPLGFGAQRELLGVAGGGASGGGATLPRGASSALDALGPLTGEAVADVDEEGEGYYGFELVTPDRVYVMRCQSRYNMTRWIEELNCAGSELVEENTVLDNIQLQLVALELVRCEAEEQVADTLSTLEGTLANRVARRHLREYARESHCAEHIDFLEDVEAYRRTVAAESRLSAAGGGGREAGAGAGGMPPPPSLLPAPLRVVSSSVSSQARSTASQGSVGDDEAPPPPPPPLPRPGSPPPPPPPGSGPGGQASAMPMLPRHIESFSGRPKDARMVPPPSQQSQAAPLSSGEVILSRFVRPTSTYALSFSRDEVLAAEAAVARGDPMRTAFDALYRQELSYIELEIFSKYLVSEHHRRSLLDIRLPPDWASGEPVGRYDYTSYLGLIDEAYVSVPYQDVQLPGSRSGGGTDADTFDSIAARDELLIEEEPSSPPPPPPPPPPPNRMSAATANSRT